MNCNNGNVGDYFVGESLLCSGSTLQRPKQEGGMGLIDISVKIYLFLVREWHQ